MYMVQRLLFFVLTGITNIKQQCSTTIAVWTGSCEVIFPTFHIMKKSLQLAGILAPETAGERVSRVGVKTLVE
jgi:hypothetical protein